MSHGTAPPDYKYFVMHYVPFLVGVTGCYKMHDCNISDLCGKNTANISLLSQYLIKPCNLDDNFVSTSVPEINVELCSNISFN